MLLPPGRGVSASAAAGEKPPEAEAAKHGPAEGRRERPKAKAHELVAEGNRLLAEGDHDGAIRSYGAAQEKRPNAPEVDLDLGLAHVRKGEHDRAAEYFASAAAKADGVLASRAKYNLGNVRAKQGRLEDAIDSYKEALLADPSNADASHNLDLVKRHLEALKRLEEMRKKLEEEFKRRLEALVKELGELVELQARALARTWSTDYESAGPIAVKADMEALQGLAKEAKPVPDELAAKLARRLVNARRLEERPSSARELSRTETEFAERARKAAEDSAILAADIRKASGQDRPVPGAQPGRAPPAAGAPPAGAEKPPENPIIGKLERAGGAAEEAGAKLDEAAAALASSAPAPIREAEPREAVAFWKLVTALGELVAPPPGQQGGMSEEMKKPFKRMAELRGRQAALILDVWASFPDARGKLPTPDEQKAFWEKVRSGEAPSEEERAPFARLEIAAAGRTGEAREVAELAEAEKKLASDSRGLAAEAEALAAKQGGGKPGGAAALGPLLGMLRGAAEAMDEAAGSLEAAPPDARAAEASAVLAFVRLSRAPDQLTELMARLGQLLAEETGRLLDTWASDPAARGPVLTPEDAKALQEALAKSQAGQGAAGQGAGPGAGLYLEPETQAKLGRSMAAAIERAARDAGKEAGAKLPGGEAAELQSDVAGRTREASADMRALASKGGQGEMNPAAPLLEGAAKDVDQAASSMDNAAAALPRSFAEAEPEQARAVAALMRALSRFASGAAGQSGEQEKGERGQEQEKREAQGKEDEQEKADAARAEERPDEDKDEKKDDEKPKDISAELAKEMLKEAAQQERDVRRDMRKRTGRKGVEVRRDW